LILKRHFYRSQGRKFYPFKIYSRPEIDIKLILEIQKTIMLRMTMVVPLLLLVLLSGSSSGNSSSSSSNNYKYLMQVEILLVGKLEGNDSYEEPMEAGHLDKFQTADM
jgi:hypothetical protein